MALDMHLKKKTYVGNKWRKPEQQVKVIVPKDQTGVFLPTGKIANERISEISEEIAYWRKANAIHMWFVENVQDGNGDCGTYYVSREKLQELLETVTKVLDASELVDGEVINGYGFKNGKSEPVIEKGKVIKDPATAKKLLPAQSGFFFGSTEYDQYYLEDLTYTKKVLAEVLQEDGDFYYSSS